VVLDRINNWFTLSKQYFFTYSEGFFNLSYLSNSPEAIIKSCIKMPFMNHNAEKQLIQADTPFMKGDFYYAELEDGLWFLNTKQVYKNNVSFKPIYDQFLPTDYYVIALNTVQSKSKTQNYKFGDVVIENNSVSFSKPGNDEVNYHFKDSSENMYMLYFNKEWANKNILGSPSTPTAIERMFNDKHQVFINYCHSNLSFQKLTNNLINAFEDSEKPNTFLLKVLSLEFLGLFYNLFDERTGFVSADLASDSLLKIKKIEHELMTNLHGKFLGIDYFSKEYKISPTKLKQDFKAVYGSSIFTFFQMHKMDLALKYLTDSNLKIKEIAQELSYENVSKFSKTFKKFHGKLPSDLK
tara:strand:+ start:13181 stop:14239 length:1059 start_codon:yes stop_codon:yes gene_type:complete